MRVEASDGFWVMLAALWCADETNVLPLFLLAAVFHELGHLLVLYISGGSLRKLSLTVCGAVLGCNLPQGNYSKAAICLAGPAASFLLTAAAGYLGLFRLAGASVLLGMFNLLPLPPLDGGMALYHLADGRLGNLRKAVGTLSLLLLGVLGVWLMSHGGGCWLLAMWVILSARDVKNLVKGAFLV